MASQTDQGTVIGPLVIDIPDYASAYDLDAYLSEVDSESSRSAQSYVFRLSPALQDELLTSDSIEARKDLRRRTPKPLQFLSYKESGFLLSEMGGDGSIIPTSDALIAQIRQADLHRIVRGCEDVCFYPATAKHHFVAPSLKHCSSFFRLGDAIRSRHALDTIAFWLQRCVTDCDAILIDTWSIASVVLRAQQLANAHRPFDSLAAHPQRAREEAAQVIQGLINRCQGRRRIACIVSVESSGRYVDIVTELCNALGAESVTPVGIYALANVKPSKALCALDLEPKNYPADNCLLCDQGSEPIALHPGLYYLKDLPEKPTILGPRYFATNPPPKAKAAKAPPPGFFETLRSWLRCSPRGEHNTLQGAIQPKAGRTSEFIREYGAIPGVFKVHRTNRHQRHHAFHVNVSPLLQQPRFLQRYEGLLAMQEAPDVIICPKDEVAIAMAQIAGERYARRVVVIDEISRPNLDTLAADDRRAIEDGDSYLIVDDVLVSGSRLTAYNVALRGLKKPKAIRFVVGLARPPSQREWSQHRVQLTKNVDWTASLDAVEELWLPDWGARHCPWCRELEFLRSAARMAEPPPWLTERIAHLDQSEIGVSSAPVWLLPGVTEPRLANGSLLGPEGIDPVATIFGLVSALQRLRHDPDEPLNPHFPDFRVFGVTNLRNYSDGLIQAVILRTVLPKEWGLTSQAKALAEVVEWAARKDDGILILGEILLAVARGVMDTGVLARLQPLYRDSHLEAFDVLLQALRR